MSSIRGGRRPRHGAGGVANAALRRRLSSLERGDASFFSQCRVNEEV